MKPAAAIHIIALTACLAAHLAFSHELQGVRRALETMKPVSAPIAMMAEIIEAA